MTSVNLNSESVPEVHGTRQIQAHPDGAADAAIKLRTAVTRLVFLDGSNAPISRADVLMVLCGTGFSTTDASVAHLVSTGSSRLLFSGAQSGSSDNLRSLGAERCAARALESGVARDRIIVEAKSRNLLENFSFARPLLFDHVSPFQTRSVCIVCAAHLSCRSLMSALGQFPAETSISVLPVVDDRMVHPDTWWTSVNSREVVLGEVQRIGAYALRGDLGGIAQPELSHDRLPHAPRD